MSAEDAAPAAAGGAKNALGKKIGPLPLGVWIAVVATGAGIAYVANRGARANAATTTDGTEFTDRLDNTMPGAGNLAGALGAVVDTAASLVAAYSTNEEWQSVALRKLISKGWDPTTADAALRAYMGSQTLTTAQKQAIDDALIGVGPPPVSPPLPASGYLVEPTPAKTATPTQAEQGTTPPAITIPPPMTTSPPVSFSTSYGGAAGGTAANPVIYSSGLTWEQRGYGSQEQAERADAYAAANGLPTGKVFGSGW